MKAAMFRKTVVGAPWSVIRGRKAGDKSHKSFRFTLIERVSR